MSKYFKIIGYIELVGTLVLIIWRLIALFTDLSNVSSTIEKGGALIIFLDFLILFAAIFFAPAVGLLFVSYGYHIEPSTATYSYKDSAQSTGNNCLNSNAQNHSFNNNNYPQSQVLHGSVDLPTTILASDVLFKKNKIIIKGSSFRKPTITKLKRTSKGVFFGIGNENFEVRYADIDSEEADSLYEKLKEASINFGDNRTNN